MKDRQEEHGFVAGREAGRDGGGGTRKRGKREEEARRGFNVHTHISKDRLQRPVQSAREGREEEEEEKGRKKKDKSLNSVEAEHIISEGCVSSF